MFLHRCCPLGSQLVLVCTHPLCDEVGQWWRFSCGDSTTFGVGGDTTTGGIVVDATIFWVSLVCVFPDNVAGKCCCFCIVPCLSTLGCPVVSGLIWLFYYAQVSYVIVIILLMTSTSHFSCLVFFSPMFGSSSSHSTCAKCLVATTMVSALLTASIVMFLCLKYNVSAMHVLPVSLIQI